MLISAAVAVSATRNVATAPASRPAARSSRSASELYAGTNAPESAPSPSRFWRKFGIRMAAAKASPMVPIPSTLVTSAVRAKPDSRETPMPAAAAAAPCCRRIWEAARTGEPVGSAVEPQFHLLAGFVFADVHADGQFRDQNLPGLLQHRLLAG